MTMTIGTLAEAAGVKVPTVRYYERRGIIAELAAQSFRTDVSKLSCCA